MGRRAQVFQQGHPAGILEELEGSRHRFTYTEGYSGEPVSLALPVEGRSYEFDRFPPIFEGLLPEGPQLEALLRREKLDRGDLLGQLLAVGEDLVGSLAVRRID